MYLLRKRMFMEADGVPAGGSVTPPVAPPATPETPTPAAGTAASAPLGFSWDSVTLTPEMKNLVAERQWKDVDSALTSYRNLEKLTGVPPEQMVKIPKGNDPNEWNAVFNKLGRPETADKYVLPVPEGDKGEFAGVAKAWFHEAGVSQSAATKLAEKWNGFMADTQKAEAQKAADANQIQVNDLKSEWGGNYDANAALVDKAAETFGMNQEQLTALKNVLGPKQAMTFLHNIGKGLGVEDSMTAGMSNARPGTFVMSPEQATAKIRALKSDKAFVQMFSSEDPRTRSEARGEMERLVKLAAPGSTATGIR